LFFPLSIKKIKQLLSDINRRIFGRTKENLFICINNKLNTPHMINTISTEGNRSRLVRSKFQKTVDTKQTDLFILKNPLGMEVAVTNYGCAILSIMVPDREGNYANVVLGHDSIDSVINSPEPFLNTVIGRYGNRISQGKFVLDNTEYTLNINNGPNSLHGGPQGFHAKVWDAKQPNAQTLVLHYASADGEEGFPGNVDVTLTYSLEDSENSLIMEYRATTDQTTVINLTNHAFFNLAGIAHPTPSIESHVVAINAEFYVPIDEVCIPTGEILKVEGTPMDFRTPHAIGEQINDLFPQLVNGSGYDHCYVLDKDEQGAFSWAASCLDPHSGRMLEVYTTEPGLQLYTGNWLSGFAGAHKATYPTRSGICFEAQCFPDTPNRPHFLTAALTPEDEYQQVTIYKFDVQD
jgi:aldose 1-epimerase